MTEEKTYSDSKSSSMKEIRTFETGQTLKFVVRGDSLCELEMEDYLLDGAVVVEVEVKAVKNIKFTLE